MEDSGEPTLWLPKGMRQASRRLTHQWRHLDSSACRSLFRVFSLGGRRRCSNRVFVLQLYIITSLHRPRGDSGNGQKLGGVGGGKAQTFASSSGRSFPSSCFEFLFCLLAATAAKSLQSCPTLCDPIDGSHQVPPSLGFSRQEHWSGLPFPSPMHESGK